LGRTLTRLRENKPLTIVFFGGSITQGTGVPNPEQASYRGLTTQWFRNTYPNSQITSVDASIGGTGSQLGAYRCQHDVLSHNPDLVIVEFALNDYLQGDADILRQIEGIVRQVFTANPQSEILFVYTCNQVIGKDYSAGRIPHSVADDQSIATAYQIGSVNVGKAQWQAIQDGHGTWASLTIDMTHPNQAGYQIYANTMIQYLTAHQNDKAQPPLTSFPAGLSVNPIANGQLIPATTLPVPSGWTVRRVPYFPLPNVLFNNQVGATFTYSFVGTDIGILVRWAPDGANLSYSLDGSAFKPTLAMSDGPGRDFRPYPIFFGDNLPNKSHTLVLQINAPGDRVAAGTSMYLGGFLTYNPAVKPGVAVPTDTPAMSP
jgi:lysophospholipase L1-like esterase